MEQIYITLHPNEDDLFRLNSNSKAPRVIDIGAASGEFASRIKEQVPLVELHLVEPLPKFIEVLHRKFKTDPKVTIYPFGISDKNSTEPLLLLKESSRLIRKGNFKSTEIEWVEITEVNNFLDNFHGDIDLIQINCEGEEYNILSSLSSPNMSKLRNLNIQFHNISPQNILKRRKLSKKLSKSHRRIWSVPFIWERWERKF